MITSNTVLLQRIESRIQVIRGLRVMLDVDLAALRGRILDRAEAAPASGLDRSAGAAGAAGGEAE